MNLASKGWTQSFAKQKHLKKIEIREEWFNKKLCYNAHDIALLGEDPKVMTIVVINEKTQHLQQVPEITSQLRS